MTQLALLLALSLLGLVLSFVFGRLEVKRVAVSATVKRVEGALDRASVALLRLGALRGLALCAVCGVGLAIFALMSGARAGVSGAERAIFLLGSLLAGAGSTLVQARLTLGLGTRAAASAAAAIARGSARAMRPLLRASVAVAVFGEALGLLGLAAAFASLYAVRGGFALVGGNAQLAAEIVRLLPAFALGAGAVALALAREGSVAATAVQLGANASRAAFEAGDARDPALLAELVGQQAGELLPRALASYVCGLTATVSAALVAVSGVSANAPVLASLLLVVLVRAFGCVAAVCGVFAARASADEAPENALWRAQGSAVLVALFSLGAALFWLQREHLLALFGAGAAGLLTMALVGQLSWRPLRRGARATRELLEGRNAGEAATIVRGASVGFASAWPALVAPALALALVERALSTSTPSGLLLVSFAAGAQALGPLASAFFGFGLLSQHTRGVANLARLEVELGRRHGRLDEASGLASAIGSSHASLAVSFSLLLGFVALSNASPTTAPSLGVAALAMLAGITLVLVFGARTTRSAIVGARLVALEVERQLPRAGVAPAADFAPSYRACVDAALSAARGASVIELGLLLLAPFALGAGLRFGLPAALGAPLLGFATAAVLGSLVFTLGGRALRAVLSELRRRARVSESSSGPHAGVQAEAFGELVGVTAASSVEALGLVLALTVLCLAPLLR